MIAHIANLTRWEWFKVQRRWLPWILLVVLLALSQLFVWGSYFGYRDNVWRSDSIMAPSTAPGQPPLRISCSQLRAGNVSQLPPGLTRSDALQMCDATQQGMQSALAAERQDFTLPNSLVSVYSVAQDFGLILIAILTASVVGMEYGWGTLRVVLAKGTGRWQYLGAKLVLAGLLAFAALLVVGAGTVVSSLIADRLAGATPAWAGATQATWLDGLLTLGKAWVALLPYLSFAALATIVGGSTAAGLSVSLGYRFLELIAVTLLMNLFTWFTRIADYTLGRNIAAWMAGGRRASVFGGALLTGEAPGTLHALVVVLAYTVVLGGLAFWVFQRRDVGGAKGG